MNQFHGTYRHLVDTFGPVHPDGEPWWPADLALGAFKSRIPPEFRQGGASPKTFVEDLQAQGSAKIDMKGLHLHPQQPIEGARAYASLIYAPKLTVYWVFVYYKLPPQGAEQDAASGAVPSSAGAFP